MAQMMIHKISLHGAPPTSSVSFLKGNISFWKCFKLVFNVLFVRLLKVRSHHGWCGKVQIPQGSSDRAAHRGPVHDGGAAFHSHYYLIFPDRNDISRTEYSSLFLEGLLSLHWPAFSPTRCGRHEELLSGYHLPACLAAIWLMWAQGCQRGDRWTGGSAYGGFQEYFTPDVGILYVRNKVASRTSRGSRLLVM